MPKSLNPASTTEVAKALGTEPIIVVEVDWGDAAPTTQYADKDYDGVEGKIISLSAIDTIVKFGGTGSSGNLAITLDDTDGSIKVLELWDLTEARSYNSRTFLDPMLVRSLP